MAALVSAGVMESGGTVRSRTRSCARRSTETCRPPNASGCISAAARVLRERGAPAGPGRRACHAHRDRRATPGRWHCCATPRATRSRWATQPARPRSSPVRSTSPRLSANAPAVVLELGQAYARAGAPEAIEPLTEIVERGEDPAAIAAAAIELSGMLFFAGRAAGGSRDSAARPGRGSRLGRAGPRAARGRAAGRQLHLGVGPARGRRRDRRRCGIPAARRAGAARRRRSPRSQWTR